MQIWSFRDRKLVANKKLAQQTYAKTSDIPTDYDRGFVRYTSSGSELVVYWKGRFCSKGRLLVFDSTTLDELQNIDLGCLPGLVFLRACRISIRLSSMFRSTSAEDERYPAGMGRLRRR